MLKGPTFFAKPVQDLIPPVITDPLVKPTVLPPMNVGQQASTEAKTAGQGQTPGVPGGIGGTIAALLHAITSGGQKGGVSGSPGLSHFGDFDLDTFLEGSLRKSDAGGNDGIKKILGGITRMLGGGK